MAHERVADEDRLEYRADVRGRGGLCRVVVVGQGAVLERVLVVHVVPPDVRVGFALGQPVVGFLVLLLEHHRVHVVARGEQDVAFRQEGAVHREHDGVARGSADDARRPHDREDRRWCRHRSRYGILGGGRLSRRARDSVEAPEARELTFFAWFEETSDNCETSKPSGSMGTNRRFTTRQKYRERSPMGKQYGQSLESPRAEAGKARVPFGGLSSAVTAPRAKAGRRLAHAPKDQFGRGEHPRLAPFEEDSRRQRTYPREGQPRQERIWNG